MSRVPDRQPRRAFTEDGHLLIKTGLFEVVLNMLLSPSTESQRPTYTKDSMAQTGSFRIIHGNDWVDTIHLDKTTAEKEFYSGSCVAEFISFSRTDSIFEATSDVNFGQNTYDINVLPSILSDRMNLDSLAAAPLTAAGSSTANTLGQTTQTQDIIDPERLE